jgi:hypothetical protein
MKTSKFSIIIAGILFAGCMTPAEKQYFQESADIEIGKKVINAYLAGDWATAAENYADTARIWRNVSWETNPGFTVEEYIADLKEPLEVTSSYDFDPQNWESIITDDGQHWVHFWGVWKGANTATEKDYEIVVHVSMEVDNGKIVRQADIFNDTQITMDMMALQMEAEEGAQDNDDGDGM